MTHFIHVTDAPVTLARGESISGHRFVTGGSLYGRVLFTEQPIALVLAGENTVERCEFVGGGISFHA